MEVPLTPLRFLERSEAIYGAEPAIVCAGTRLSYRDYAERVRRLAGALAAFGVARGDRVLYLGMNCHRLLELYYAVLPLQAILVPVNVRLAPAEIAFILADSAPTVLVASPELLPLIERVPVPPSVRERILAYPPAGQQAPPAGWSDYEALLAQAEPRPLDAAVDERAVAEIFYTSGTTARPRGVMLSHRSLYLHAMNTIIALGITDRDRMLVGSVPLFHVNAWGTPQFMVAVGGVQVVVPRFEPALFCQAVERERCTLSLMVPTMLNALLQYPDLGRHDLSSLRSLVLGGAPPVPELMRQARAALPGVVCQVGYGLTETSPVVSCAVIKNALADAPAEERLRRQGLTGLPVIGTQVRVVREDGSEVRHDGSEVGEILVRGDQVMEGYWNQPEETARALRDGYLATGDLAVVDAEGYLNIVDRKKDIIISGGENISSVEVETVLYTHPAVLEAAVVAAPDPHWGEVPVAFVALRPGAEADADALRAHAQGLLAHFKVPRAFVFVQELPKTGTGKIQKAELRRRWAESHPAA
jgi:fatty-acyl-CoA synthase